MSRPQRTPTRPAGRPARALLREVVVASVSATGEDLLALLWRPGAPAGRQPARSALCGAVSCDASCRRRARGQAGARRAATVGHEATQSERSYVFVNVGVRFSANALMPSFWSASAKVAWKLRRSRRRPSCSGDSYAEFTHSFASRAAGCE